jgi:hypothetical protein
VSADLKRCKSCGGFFDPLSRQASQNAMGPWFIRDPRRPFRPGCSYETLKHLVARGRVTQTTVLRGPSTRQNWSFAARAPGVANLLGICHNCQREVNPDDERCRACGASFEVETDRQVLGLAPVHLLPGQAAPEAIADASIGAHHDETIEPVPAAGVVDARARPGSHRALIALLSLLVFVLAVALAVLLVGPRLGLDLGPFGGTGEAPRPAPGPASEGPPVSQPVEIETAEAPAAVTPVRAEASPEPVTPEPPVPVAGSVVAATVREAVFDGAASVESLQGVIEGQRAVTPEDREWLDLAGRRVTRLSSGWLP